ncbi:hypothetical protein DSY1053 [Desulfitobacterium hafniense Y51]|uniref:Uncharacterized protein n=1 Tax=Desulfitobacterium hafniense (strain Y51) TaxID=138119 RepID=Q24YQ0_DESHY|nr:hypothetical protein DSY1053 [Desulfitobacterium hafniense Y51]
MPCAVRTERLRNQWIIFRGFLAGGHSLIVSAMVSSSFWASFLFSSFSFASRWVRLVRAVVSSKKQDFFGLMGNHIDFSRDHQRRPFSH